MDLKAGLWQQQSMKLAMTQELSQAIALLQYSTVELVDFLENKALENPLLQIESNKHDSFQNRKNRKSRSLIDKQWIDQIGDQRLTLADHIHPQLHDYPLTAKQKKLIVHFIDHLDNNGYFTGDLPEIATKLQIPLSEVENCLFILQNLEPAGIGARNLRECLLLQIQRKPSKNTLAETIITDYFTMFADRKWKALAKILSVDLKEIQQVFDYILNLNPKPGSSFQYERAPYVVPDVMVTQEDGQLVVRLYDSSLPKILFNQSYYKQLSTCQDKKVTEFLHDKKQDYQWIIRSVDQRQRTIFNVTTKIVEKQQAYFQKGPDFLTPMTMRDISDELDIHESTVSRTVREKYVQTPFGTVELKSFFTNAIESVQEDALSSAKVKKTMVKLVEQEDKRKPLSDVAIVNKLTKDHGIVVSRRTVAKYRDTLGIPASSKRKRYD